MQLATPQLNFPLAFCCNCGDPNCVTEIQDTRVTRYLGLGGSETTFHLPIPVCARCRRTTRRRPPGLFGRLLVAGVLICVCFLALLIVSKYTTLPLWMADRRFTVSAALAVMIAILFYRVRRPGPPQTSFYQPVRIKSLRVQITDVPNGQGHVAYMKLGFTNPDYLNIFVQANADAIAARQVAAGKA
jgi:hypothetical protein